MELYNFQTEGVDFALKHNYTINGCEMGLGKTAQALTAMSQLNVRTLIVCPAYLKHNWHQELTKFAPDFDENKVSIISYNQFVLDYSDYYTCDLVIFDEAHYLKNMPSQRTKRAHLFIKNTTPSHLLLLTGTPITNRVTEFYSLLKLCSYNPQNTNGLRIKNTFNKFASVLTNVAYVTASSGFTVKKYTGLRNKHILDKYLEYKYFRRTAKNELDLPAIIYSKVFTDTQPCGEDEKLLETAFEGKDTNHISVAKAKSAAFKARATFQFARELLDQGEGPLVIFTDHKLAGQFIYDSLKYKFYCTWIHGGVAADIRYKAVEDLNSLKLNVLIATIGSFSTGVNLTSASRIIFNDQSWVPANNLQAEKRIHRIGQNKTCFITHILAKGIDCIIHKNLQEKMEVLNALAGE